MLVSTPTNKFHVETMISSNDEDLWENMKTFFNPQNSMIILAIICLIFFFITLCLIIMILQLLKKKRLYQNQAKSTYLNFPSLPMQTGLTSNQIASLGNILPSNTNPQQSISIHESNKTQSFETLANNDLKRVWNEKEIKTSNTNLKPTTSSSLSSTTNNNNDDEIETVNEVLGMEERNGKIYYKVNFTGHPSDYTAWVCEEDLIPE